MGIGMTKKVAFVHTVVALADRFKQQMAEFFPDVRAFHIVDESLINDVLESGELTSSVMRRLSAHVLLAREAGADHYLVKGFPASELARLIEASLQGVSDEEIIPPDSV